jgi:hypothetical protein
METPFVYATFQYFSHRKDVELQFKWLGKVKEGVRTQLDQSILKYRQCRWDDSIQGVMLSYHSVKLLDKEIRLLGDFPAMRIAVRYSGIFFGPRSGQILREGHLELTLTKVSRKQIVGKVFGLFPISFEQEDKETSLVGFDEETDTYLWKETGQPLIKGTELYGEVLE